MKFLIFLALFTPGLLVLYALISYLRFLFFRIPPRQSETFSEPVSIIIAGYNEERFIEQKIRSFLNPVEWIPGSEIIVVSTGSNDNTNRILQQFHTYPEIQVIISDVRITKIMAVNKAVALSVNNYLVFSDCRQEMKPGSVKALLANFKDPCVGTVTAVLQDYMSEGTVSFARKWINKLVYWNSQTGSGLNVHGALYAQRKSVFCPFPTDILFDDLMVIVSTLQQGKRLIQEPKAVIYDLPFSEYYRSERIQRLTRGLLIFLIRYKGQIQLLSWKNQYRFLLFKYAKLTIPFSVLIWLELLLYQIIYDKAGVVLLFCLTILGTILVDEKLRTSFFLFVRIQYYFFLATVKFIFFRKQSIEWEKLKMDRKYTNR